MLPVLLLVLPLLLLPVASGAGPVACATHMCCRLCHRLGPSAAAECSVGRGPVHTAGYAACRAARMLLLLLPVASGAGPVALAILRCCRLCYCLNPVSKKTPAKTFDGRQLKFAQRLPKNGPQSAEPGPDIKSKFRIQK
jgi:hypothetical protein